jgi:hypothetical protein
VLIHLLISYNTEYDVTWPPNQEVVGYQRWKTIGGGNNSKEGEFALACNAYVQQSCFVACAS